MSTRISEDIRCQCTRKCCLAVEMLTAAAHTHTKMWRKQPCNIQVPFIMHMKTSASLRPSCTHADTHMMTIMVLQKIHPSLTVYCITSHFFSKPAPGFFFSPFFSWRAVLICEQWVNEDHFAVWADGEHWSACWQVAYSLLSELALSHLQWDTQKHTPMHTHRSSFEP